MTGKIFLKAIDQRGDCVQVQKYMRLQDSSAFSTIKLAEGNAVPKRVQYLRVGKFNHPKYGKFEITPVILAELKKSFDNKVRGIDTSFDYFHDSDKEASAWVQSFELSEDGQGLYANVEWTPVAEKKLAEKELKYFSPDFGFKWTNPETGEVHKNVIFGGGLTNRPFVKGMDAIVASENKETEMKTVEELTAENLKLSEEKSSLEKQMGEMQPNSAVDELKAKIAELQGQLAKLQGDNEAALSEKKQLEEKIACSEKEAEFTVLLSEGKACAAQKEAFMKNDMKEFLKLAEKVNLNNQGNGGGAGESGDEVEKTIKLAEEKQKADPKLSRGEAISLARKELKK